MALPPSLGADGPACSSERRFCCIIGGAGYWDTTRASRSTPACARSSMCQRAATTHEADILRRGGQHTAGSPSPGGSHVCACGRPTEASGGPICRPIPGGLQGGQDLSIQADQRQEIISVDRLKAHNGLSPVSPAETASCGRPPRMPAAPSIQPTFMKMQTGGGSCGGLYSL